MISIRLSKELESRLDNLAVKTGRNRSYYVRQAIEKFLEDQEDYLLAVSRLEKKNPRISLDDLEKELGLDN